jgi:hypothetical protein
VLAADGVPKVQFVPAPVQAHVIGVSPVALAEQFVVAGAWFNVGEHETEVIVGATPPPPDWEIVPSLIDPVAPVPRFV